MKLMQAAEDSFADLNDLTWIKVIERGGDKLKDILSNSKPWKATHCGREDCLICVSAVSQDSKIPHEFKTMLGTCKQRNVTYRIICVNCLRNGLLSTYTGETGRSAYERAKEHLAGLRKVARDSPDPTVIS